MHELSIAQAILAIALDHSGGRRVTAVALRVGHLRQVVPDALAFSFEVVARGSAADGARLHVEHVPVEARCRACGAHSRQAELPFACAACGAFDIEVVRGEELCVESLELEEAA